LGLCALSFSVSFCALFLSSFLCVVIRSHTHHTNTHSRRKDKTSTQAALFTLLHYVKNVSRDCKQQQLKKWDPHPRKERFKKAVYKHGIEKKARGKERGKAIRLSKKKQKKKTESCASSSGKKGNQQSNQK
jgi:hypothetical protein